MILHIPLARIQPNPWQTRITTPDPEYIKSLALDIAAHGLLQAPAGRVIFLNKPIDLLGSEPNQDYLDRKLEDPSYTVQLAFGHNRLAAYQWLNDLRDNSDIKGDYSRLPVSIQSYTDQQMAEIAWSENEQRRDVTPIERAKAIEKRMASFGWSQSEIADRLGLARPTVSNILRLLKLPQEIQDALNRGDISTRVASALLPMYDLPPETLASAEREYFNAPSRIIKSSLDGESSDRIRSAVENLYRNYTRNLQNAEFGLDEPFPENIQVDGYDHPGFSSTVYCGLCRPCDRRLKHDGNLCLDIGCYSAKTILYRRRYLANAAGACGIEVSDPTKGGQVTPMPYNDDKARQILATRCSNLRLIYSIDKLKYPDNPRAVDGFPHALIICDKRNGSCTCSKGLDQAARTPLTFSVDPDWEGPESIDPQVELENELMKHGFGSSENVDPDDPEDELEFTPEDIAAGEAYGRQQYEERAAVRAQTPSSAQLEDLARQARQAKKDAADHRQVLADRLSAFALEWLRELQPGAIAILTSGSCVPPSRDKDKIFRRAASRIAETILSTSVFDSIDSMYETINQRLSYNGLPEISRSLTLAEVLAQEKD